VSTASREEGVVTKRGRGMLALEGKTLSQGGTFWKERERSMVEEPDKGPEVSRDNEEFQLAGENNDGLNGGGVPSRDQ